MELPDSGHDPVLLGQVLQLLAPQPGQIAVDCTLGRAGHSLALAEHLAPTGTLIALDADPRNLEYARQRLAHAPCAVRFFHANFAELGDVLAAAGIPKVHLILADLGISTNQLFDADYGLSFASDMPLDMRLDPRIRRTAADLVNTLRESDLADLLYQYAQERYSRRIARKIAESRRISPIKTTERLAELVRQAYPQRGGAPDRIDPATRTFMALRMAVNGEMDNLTAFLRQAPAHLHPNGRLAVISFHSMEDREVKQTFRSWETQELAQPLTRKPVVPDDVEVAQNPRSRSAKLRAVVRTGSRL